MKDIVDRMTLWVTKMVQEGSKPTLTKPAWHGGFGWAHKVIKAGEGRQTARRLAREQQNRHATQANTHQILVHGKHCMEESVLIFIAKVYWLAVSTIPQGERKTWRNKQSQIRAKLDENGRTFKVTKRRQYFPVYFNQQHVWAKSFQAKNVAQNVSAPGENSTST